jgi:hypothetical protein
VRGEGGSTADDIMVMGVDVEANLFVTAADAAESYQERRAEPIRDCAAPPREVAALGAQAFEASCVVPGKTNEHVLNVLDDGLHVVIWTHAAASGKVPDSADAAAMNVALARSVLAALRRS